MVPPALTELRAPSLDTAQQYNIRVAEMRFRLNDTGFERLSLDPAGNRHEHVRGHLCLKQPSDTVRSGGSGRPISSVGDGIYSFDEVGPLFGKCNNSAVKPLPVGAKVLAISY
jgi:hypothetical protein